MKCCQEKCEKEATVLIHWPGEEPKPMCSEDALRAQGIGKAMGFRAAAEKIPERQDEDELVIVKAKLIAAEAATAIERGRAEKAEAEIQTQRDRVTMHLRTAEEIQLAYAETRKERNRAIERAEEAETKNKELSDILKCVQAAVVGEANGIPTDLREQLFRATAALSSTTGSEELSQPRWTLEEIEAAGRRADGGIISPTGNLGPGPQWRRAFHAALLGGKEGKS